MKVRFNYRTTQKMMHVLMSLCIFLLLAAQASAMPNITYAASSILSSNGGQLSHSTLFRAIPLLVLGMLSYIGTIEPPDIKIL